MMFASLSGTDSISSLLDFADSLFIETPNLSQQNKLPMSINFIPQKLFLI